MKIAGYYDIETEDWDQFVCGGLLTADNDYAEYTWKDERDYALHLLSIEGTLLAHNGGKFDHLWFLDALDRHGLLSKLSVSLTMSGASIVRADFKGEGISLTLADSWKMFMPLSLRELSNGGKDSTGLKCKGQGACADLIAYQRRYTPDAINGCGGYCRISRRMPHRDLRRLMDYMENDCRALKSGVEHMAGVAESLNIKLGWTVGSTAWKTAVSMIDDLPMQELTGMEYEYARNGFFGGRVSLFRRFADSGFQYDITSSYPNQCGMPLPRPMDRNLLSDARTARRAFVKGKDGIYSGLVKIPDMHIPPLPYRANANGENRLTFPIGTIRGTWALPELQYAESLGCKFQAESALVYKSSENYLASFMSFMIEQRIRFGKKTREGQWLKWIANSLYGKLASKPDVENIYLNPSEDLLLGSENQIRRIGTRLGIYIVPHYRILDCAHITWAAYITARARVQLHRMLNKYQGSDAVYCDTDSCFSMRKRTKADGVGYGLGSWSNEGTFTEFQGIAPKVYRYMRGDKAVMRAKGVVLPHDLDKAWELIKAGQRVNGRARIRGFRSALQKIMRTGKGSIFEKEIPHRMVKEGFGDRIDLGNGLSRPPHSSELQIATEGIDDDLAA